MKMKKSVTMSIVVLLLVAGGAWAVVWDGTPSKDVGLYGGALSDRNFGLAISGDVGVWGGPYYRTLAQYDLPGDLAGKTVLAATLEWDVRETGGGQAGGIFFIGGVEHPWVEGTGSGAPGVPPDGATQATSDGTTAWEYLAPLTKDGGGAYVMYDTVDVPQFDYINDLTVAGTFMFDDITALVQEWADGRPNYGLALAKTEDQDGSVSVFCKEGVPSDGARLHIEYVPEPATMLLVGIGGLVGLRRWKK